MSKQIKSLYSCKPNTLYAALILTWGFCKNNLDHFTKLKKKYTDTYIQTMLDQVVAAEALVSAKEMVSQRNNIRIALVAAAKVVMDNWQLLKGYIEDAYSPENWANQLETAGQSSYLKAGSDNWASVADLVTKGGRFLEKNAAELQANQNMPDEFITTFKTGGVAYTALAKKYAIADSVKSVDNTAKITANNLAYANAMAMCKDGKRLFINPVRQQFTFSSLKKMVGKGGSAGIRGLAADTAGTLLQGVEVTVEGSDKRGKTNKLGRYIVKQLSEGEVTVTFSKPGYVSLTKTFTLKTGTISSFSVELMKIAMAA